jgi:hypothetical protein
MKIDRRTAMLWAASVAATFRVGTGAFAMAPLPAKPIGTPGGYGLDPNIIEGKTPWPRTLSSDQLKAIIALCDFILPPEAGALGASDIGVQEMIDEWVSAPYPDQVSDRLLILRGLQWMDATASSLGAARFTAGTVPQQTAVLARLALSTGTSDASSAPDGFYRKVRKLVIGGYYTTPEGFKDIGYIGNVAMTTYPEPSTEVLAALERAYVTLGLKP